MNPIYSDEPAEATEEVRQLLAEKRHVIGGSDAQVIALEAAGKKPPFGRSAFDVWLRLTGRAPESVDTDRLEMGRLMEEPVAQRFSRRTGLRVHKVPHVLHPSFPWYGGHIDRGVFAAIPGEAAGDLECKTVEFDPLGEWSQSGEEPRVPMGYLLQATWYAGLPRDGYAAFERMIYIAAQFGLSGSLRIYRFWPGDPTLRAIHSKMFEACQRFHEEYVQKDQPPPMPEGNAAAADRWLKFKHPLAKDEEIVLGDEHFFKVAKAYDVARAQAKKWDAKKDALGAELGRLIGDHYGMTATVGGLVAKASWPSIPEKSEAVTDFEQILIDKKVDVTAEDIQRRTRIATVRSGYRTLYVSVKDPAEKKRRK